MKKILITYGSYGSGHKAVANVIKNYFVEHSKEYEIKVLDVTDYCNFLGKISVKYFDFIIKHRSEFLFSAGYEMFDNKFITKKQDFIAKILFDNSKLQKDITNFNPDLNIATHFYGANLINYYNKKGLTNSKIITILTDYKSHCCWLTDSKNQDAFIVANKIVKNELIDYGIEENKIFPFGIPFDVDKTLKLDDVFKIRNRYNIDGRYPTYVFFGGGSSGTMSYYEYFRKLVKKRYPINLIFISGKNEKLRQKSLAFVEDGKYQRVRVIGFTNDVYNLLKIADCVISKPGGSTITECMEMHTPMILVPGLGGQEGYNAKFIKQNNYGTKVRTYYGLNHEVYKTIIYPEILIKWSNNLSKNDKNKSTEQIFKLTEKLLQTKINNM